MFIVINQTPCTETRLINTTDIETSHARHVSHIYGV